MARIQFILKARQVPFVGEDELDQDGKKKQLSSGLLNSATFVSDMLRDLGHETEVIHAIDNNCIDRLVTKFKPDICIIEAYWVVPEKFEILSRLHPKIKWVIRNHSAIPFLANEGMSMDWSMRYMDYRNVYLSCNDDRTDDDMHFLLRSYKKEWTDSDAYDRLAYLPNFYPIADSHSWVFDENKEHLDVGCFGAMRPLKNHLAQAIAAIEFAEEFGKKLRFHVNGTRIEMKGEPIVNNLRKMFSHLDHELVEHNWLPHDRFVDLLKTMDLSTQVSYTETFNIVAADSVQAGVPLVTSPDIRWSDQRFQADPNSVRDIARKMISAYEFGKHDNHRWIHLSGLRKYNDASRASWSEEIERIMR